MKSSLTPRWVAVAVVVGLAGCGGSSSTRTADMTDPPTTPAGPTFRAYDLPAAVAAGLTLPQGVTEDLPLIAAGGSLTWNTARFTCETPDPAVRGCRVRLTGTSAGVRAQVAGTVLTTLQGDGDEDEVAVDPRDGGSDGLGPIAVRVVRAAAGMTEEALREHIRKEQDRFRLDSQAERDQIELEIRNQKRSGEPIYQSITGSPVPDPSALSGRYNSRDWNFSDVAPSPNHDLLENGDGSVTQSSTTHAHDAQISIDAWMRPTNLQDATAANRSGSTTTPEFEGPIYSGGDGAPAAGHQRQRWQHWSTRTDHAASLSVDKSWRTPENENAQWRDPRGGGINAVVALTGASSPPSWTDRLRQRRTTNALDISGGRTVNIDLYTDVGRSDLAGPVFLQGYTRDDSGEAPPTTGGQPGDPEGGGIVGTMHVDWRRGVDVVDFSDPNVKAPSDLESGEGERFNEQRPSVRGTYRGIPGTFHCIGARAGTNTCHITNETGIVNVRGDFRFIPNNNERVWNPDWLAIGVWHVVPDSQIHGDYEAGAFADGNDPFVASNLARATGTATYTGLAHGLYTEKMTTAAAVHRGRFTANASLTARFGDATSLGTISGRVSDFQATGSADAGRNGGDWIVNLEQIGIGLQGSVVGSTTQGCRSTRDCVSGGLPAPGGSNSFTADTSGHSRGNALEGRWGGRFYGNRVNDEGQPGYVAGTFGARSKGGPAVDGYDLNLIGGFAARRPGAP